MESLVGQTVSHYAFLEKLGAGGMGEIYKARDTRLNRIVAVKVLAPGKTRDPERRRRFIQEARAASALNHPNIITVHDILPEGDTQYLVMEHVSGRTLQELIAAAGRLPLPQALRISTQMAIALAVAHAAGIVHRDLKPANVMVTGSGLVKILDFGLAKLMDPMAPMGQAGRGEHQETLTAAPLTAEGSLMGTVNYMSPEQAEGKKVDARSDIFSFGAVLYEMLTGRRAFEGDSAVSTLSAVLRDEVKPIREIAPEVPDELVDLIGRCLRKNRAERWQSMAEVAAALNGLRLRADTEAAASTSAPGDPVHVPAVSMARRNRRARVVSMAAACAGVIVLAVAGTWWQMHRQSTIAPRTAHTANVKGSATERAAVPTPNAPATPDSVPVKLRDGTPFRVVLLDDVPSDTAVGHALRFRVLDGLQSGDMVVIAKGALVTGFVAALGKRNFFGGRGKARFGLTSAESVDGKVVVRATPSSKSDGAETRPFESSKASKDQNLIATAGTEYVAYVSGDQTVNGHK